MMKKLLGVILAGVLLATGLTGIVNAEDLCTAELGRSCVTLASTGRLQALADYHESQAAAKGRATDAYAARTTGLAAYFETYASPAMRAESARYRGMADFYASQNAARVRAMRAYTARSAGLATYHGTAESLAMKASSARYQGLADFYGMARQAGGSQTVTQLTSFRGR